MGPHVRHLVFDVGRVLLHYDPDLAFRELLPDAAERAWFLAEVCSPAWNAEQDRGRSWADAEALLVAAHPTYAAHVRAFRARWHEMVPRTYPDSVAVLEELLDDGRDVTLLTNFAADTFAEARERFPVLGRARGATVSGEIGLVKPDPAVFRAHAERFGLDPAATLFVDDSPANVAGAQRAGWRAVLFVGAPQLRADLRAHGVDPGLGRPSGAAGAP